MPVTTVTSFSGDIQFMLGTTQVPPDIAASWATQLKASVSKINRNRTAIIPDGASFVSKIAVPSAAAFSGVLNPAYTNPKTQKTAAVSTAEQQAKLARAFDSWLAGINYMFGTQGGVEGKNFLDIVTAKADNWAANFGNYVYPAVGTNTTVKGPAIFIPRFLTNYPNAKDILPAGWTAAGPRDIFTASMAPQIRAALTGLLTQSFQTAVVTGFDAAVLTAINAKLVVALNGYLNAGVANQFAVPDAPPTSSLIISQGAQDIVHVACVVRTGTV